MLIDILYDLNGVDSDEIDSRYKQLKSIEHIVEERYRNGEMTVEKYNDFRAALKEYEEG